MPPILRQAAALATFEGRVCLVTSRSGRRWVIPKGQIEPGHTAGEAALVEAWEEAGLEGTLDPEPLGTYLYEKYGNQYRVVVFRMVVAEVRGRWPERGLRQRVWVSADEAALRLEEPGLREIVRSSLTFRTGSVATTSHAAARGR